MLEKVKMEPALYSEGSVYSYAEPLKTRYLLVGGTGFIAKHLCEAMNRRNSIATTISRNPCIDFIECFAPSVSALSINRAGPKFLAKHIATATHVIFAAGSDNPASMSASDDNDNQDTRALTQITESMIETQSSAHLIYISSGGQVYGKVPEWPISETAETNPITAYGQEKLASELLLRHLSKSMGLKSTVLRLSNPVGRWQFDGKHGLVSKTIRAAHSGETLKIFGTGENVRDYFDVDEFSEFLLSSIEAGRLHPGTYNIGSGLGHTEKDILKMVEDVTGRIVKTETCPKRDFDLPYSVLNYDKAKADLGWDPKISTLSMISKLSDLVARET